MSFDLHEHMRDKARRAEQRAQALEQQLDRAVRLLALACQYAAGEQAADLLTLLEAIDDREQVAATWTTERVVELLRETAA